MRARGPAGQEYKRIGELQKTQHREEFRRAVRALLMSPLMAPEHDDFGAVRRMRPELIDWFRREAGWSLLVEREGARLLKLPGDLADETRGLPGFDRRRYVLLCLACAVLERADPQITLHGLGEGLMQLATDPGLSGLGFEFTLGSATERRVVVAVCRALLDYGVLQRVAGEEDGYVRENAWEQSDALYDVQRRLLAGMLAAVRGPSTWPAAAAPVDFDARLHSLVTEHVNDSEQGRRDAIRHSLARRLLDDPVVYFSSLEPEQSEYFNNQRGPMAARLCEAAGLNAEQRAEGLALTDEYGQLSDVAMPAEGTEAHATLLVAEYLAGKMSKDRQQGSVAVEEVATFLRSSIVQYGKYWRKSEREPGAENALAEITLAKLYKLQLIGRKDSLVFPRPALARFGIGQTDIGKHKMVDNSPNQLLFQS